MRNSKYRGYYQTFDAALRKPRGDTSRLNLIITPAVLRLFSVEPSAQTGFDIGHIRAARAIVGLLGKKSPLIHSPLVNLDLWSSPIYPFIHPLARSTCLEVAFQPRVCQGFRSDSRLGNVSRKWTFFFLQDSTEIHETVVELSKIRSIDGKDRPYE